MTQSSAYSHVSAILSTFFLDASREAAMPAAPVYRFVVPVDDRWHAFRASAPLHVASRRSGIVEFWAFPAAEKQEFTVFGTGHSVEGEYCGTTFDSSSDQLVWHLFRRPVQQ